MRLEKMKQSRRRSTYFKKSPIEPLPIHSASSGMRSALRDLKDWAALGTMLLLIATAYFLGDMAPILRTFKFWAILSVILLFIAAVLYLKIKSISVSPIRRPPPHWTLLSKGCLYSGFLGFLCFLTAGWMVLLFTP